MHTHMHTTIIRAHSLTLYFKTKPKYHKSPLSSAKLFYIGCFFSFQRAAVLNDLGAKPTPTQLQISTLALCISWESWREQLNKFCTLSTVMKEGKNIPQAKLSADVFLNLGNPTSLYIMHLSQCYIMKDCFSEVFIPRVENKGRITHLVSTDIRLSTTEIQFYFHF